MKAVAEVYYKSSIDDNIHDDSVSVTDQVSNKRTIYTQIHANVGRHCVIREQFICFEYLLRNFNFELVIFHKEKGGKTE